MKLIIFTGLPGTGKSTIAEAVARKLGIPVYAKDWLEATLKRCELQPRSDDSPDLGYVGYELLTTLAERQLQLGQSVILDSVASIEPVRQQWRGLAVNYGATWAVIECICSDEDVHRQRLSNRKRYIPGWHELDWAEVERVRGYYAPWNEERLIVDTVESIETNCEKVVAHLVL